MLAEDLQTITTGILYVARMEARVVSKMLHGTGFGRFGARILRPATGRDPVAVYSEEETRAHTINSISVNACTAQLIAQVDTGPSILARRNRRRECSRGCTRYMRGGKRVGVGEDNMAEERGGTFFPREHCR